MFHKISQASIIFPFKSVISPHRTREHESPVSGFQASALCCVLAGDPTPCSSGHNKSLCFSHHARGFYHTACLQILNDNKYQGHHVGIKVAVVCATKREAKQDRYNGTATRFIDSKAKHETSSFLCVQKAVYN